MHVCIHSVAFSPVFIPTSSIFMGVSWVLIRLSSVFMRSSFVIMGRDFIEIIAVGEQRGKRTHWYPCFPDGLIFPFSFRKGFSFIQMLPHRYSQSHPCNTGYRRQNPSVPAPRSCPVRTDRNIAVVFRRPYQSRELRDD